MPDALYRLYRIENNDTRPQYNLALEEYLCHLCAQCTCDDRGGKSFFMLWRNEPSVIIGRFQDARAEVNESFMREKNIHVVRRNSGGGAVYHDLGNVNYSFITSSATNLEVMSSFARFTRPILDALKELGLPVEISGRNDIIVRLAGNRCKKISGGAEWRHEGVLLHHGTLLFDSNLDVMARALNVAPEKLQTKCDSKQGMIQPVLSVRNRVTNIKPLLARTSEAGKTREMTVGAFMNFIGDRIGGVPYTLTQNDNYEVQCLVIEKYSRPEWNLHLRTRKDNPGDTSDSMLRAKRRFRWGTIEILIIVRDNIIVSCTFRGDYFSPVDPSVIDSALTARLIGLVPRELTPEVLRERLSGFNIKEFFAGAELDDLVTLLFELE